MDSSLKTQSAKVAAIKALIKNFIGNSTVSSISTEIKSIVSGLESAIKEDIATQSQAITALATAIGEQSKNQTELITTLKTAIESDNELMAETNEQLTTIAKAVKTFTNKNNGTFVKAIGELWDVLDSIDTRLMNQNKKIKALKLLIEEFVDDGLTSDEVKEALAEAISEGIISAEEANAATEEGGE